jgi:hypothetical protein
MILLDECLPVDFRHSFPGHDRQQTMMGRKLAIILIRSRTNQMEDLLPLVPAIVKALELIQPGQSVLIPLAG